MLALKVSNFGLDRGYRQIGVNVSKGFFGLSGVWTLSNIKRVHVPILHTISARYVRYLEAWYVRCGRCHI